MPRLALLLLALSACPAPPHADTDSTTATATGDEPASSGPTTGEPAAWAVGLQLGVEQGALLSVWGPAPDEVYAVGGQLLAAGASRGALYRFDGAAWTEQPLPDDTPMLHWVYGVDGELWVVGRDGAALRREGATWVRHPTGVDTILWGVWGPTRDLLWTVGGDGVDDPPVMLRWDGAAWAAVELPATGDSAGLFKIWGSGPQDVSAVGDRGLALHFDGAAWTTRATGDPADLISVWGRSAGEHLAVGGRASGRLARWDGAAWSGETLPVPGLSGVWMDPGGAATVVGMQGTIYELMPGSSALIAQDSPTQLLLHAVFGFVDGPRFAVGGSLVGAPPYVGVIVQRL